jgi:hypothetical protein
MMTNKTLFSIAALAGFVSYCFYRAGRSTHSVKSQAKHDLHRWEGEGGNVPQVATPSPIAAAQVSRPGNGAAATH